MKKQRIYFIVNIIFSILIYVHNYYYQYNNFNFKLKCLTSILFAVLAIINTTYFIGTKKDIKELKFPIFMTLGAIFCFLGDAFIHANFVAGVVLFALGHVFYVCGYFMLQKFTKLDLMIGGGIGLLTGGFVAICPLLYFEAPVLQIACVVYAFILSFMVGKIKLFYTTS